ncbi:uncharacterized protein TM35_000451680 [Trypanosoma theileri]|uniref:Mucin-associated surface protein (MASP) n=1 Tax=Trypanosoma theileri TaxID=67003 RepID=A0A1X0NJZ7_9TRYP|nr:uncharacterized protein TM35_000451680 [Trypanosoma theileri]ORC84430.1 hypothetical protein TM35_000451680 [Trypanosoma theileri]
MMIMMRRVMCVLAVVLCCACGYTMTAAAAVDNDSPSGRGVSRGAVEVSCGAGGALRVRPAAESEWLTCGAGSRVSACGKYADLCRQRTARAAPTTRKTTIANTGNAGQPKAVMASDGSGSSNGGGVFSTILNGYHTGVWDLDVIKNTSVPPISTDPDSKVSVPPVVKVPDTSHKGKDMEDRISGQDSGDVEIPGETVLRDISDAVPPPLDKPGIFDASTSNAAISQGERNNSSEGSKLEVTAAAEIVTLESKAAETKSSANVSTDSHNAQEEGSEVPVTVSLPAETSSSGDAVPKQSTPQAHSESTTEGGDGNRTNQPTRAADTNATAESQETTSTIPPSTENITTEAPTTTPSTSTENTTTEAPITTPSPAPVPNAEISNTIASTVQKKANVDSSISPVWMRTTAPLLIVAVLFSITVY